MKKYQGVFIKNEREIANLREANRITANILDDIGDAVRPGIATMELENIARRKCEEYHVRPAFLGYAGFPFAICCSVNEVVVHGFPSESLILKEGDIVSVDFGVEYGGMTGDSARTFPVGKISELGTVKVEEYLSIERFSHVMHIGSTVTGKLSSDKDAVDAVDAILPAGTLSGAPKFRACQIIDELEGDKRGVYGGAIGYLDFTGNMDTCIAIRLVYKKNDRICIRAGAGIVADSVPENEFMECRNKARAVVTAIEMAKEDLE